MKLNTVIIGGGLAGLTAGIRLQKAGKSTAIISAGQNALHFFSGRFESVSESSADFIDFFAEAGVRLHYHEGVSLMPMGKLVPSSLSLEDVSIFPEGGLPRKALIVNFTGYHDFFSSFLAEGLENEGCACRIRFIRIDEMESLRESPSEMRSVHIARIMDKAWEKVVQEVRVLLKDEDTVILPQVFGLKDSHTPSLIRERIPAKVVFAGTLPPSVPGIRTQLQLRRRYELLGGTFLMGDEAVSAETDGARVSSISTKNLQGHPLESEFFILASGGFFSKGLASNPQKVWEPLFGLDVEALADRNEWYDPDFLKEQPYMGFGVKTDASLRALKAGEVIDNLYVAGSILGATHPELGSGAGLALRSAFAVADLIAKL